MPGGGVEENWDTLEQKAKELNKVDDEQPPPEQQQAESKVITQSDEGKTGAQDEPGEGKAEENVVEEEVPVKAKSGWGEDTGGKSGGKGKRRGLGMFNNNSRSSAKEGKSSMDMRSKSHRAFEDNEDEETETFMIPDIDEDREEDFQLTVAEAPATRYRLPTFQELDNELPRAQTGSSSRVNEDFDLSILVRLLEPPQNLSESDELWDRDRLFEEVSQSLTKERETKAEAEKQKQHSQQQHAPQQVKSRPILRRGSSRQRGGLKA